MSYVRVSSYRDPDYVFLRGNMNVRQLLNPIFYSRDVRHPDSKRQRKARVEARDRRAARRLKAQYVPLYFVDPTVYIMEYEQWEQMPYRRWRTVTVNAGDVGGSFAAKYPKLAVVMQNKLSGGAYAGK